MHLSHFFYCHLSTTLCLFVLPCSHGNVFCESTLQLIFQCPPTPTPAWKMDLGWLILTLLDSRRQAVRNGERETNVGQHWGIYSALFPELWAVGILWEKQDPHQWNESLFLQPSTMWPTTHALLVLVDPTTPSSIKQSATPAVFAYQLWSFLRSHFQPSNWEAESPANRSVLIHSFNKSSKSGADLEKFS